MGFWSSNASVGEALGQFSGGIMFGVFLISWEGVLSINVGLLFLSAVMFLLFVSDRPTAFFGPDLRVMDVQQIHEQNSEAPPSEDAIGFWEALALPG